MESGILASVRDIRRGHAVTQPLIRDVWEQTFEFLILEILGRDQFLLGVRQGVPLAVLFRARDLHGDFVVGVVEEGVFGPGQGLERVGVLGALEIGFFDRAGFAGHAAVFEEGEAWLAGEVGAGVEEVGEAEGWGDEETEAGPGGGMDMLRVHFDGQWDVICPLHAGRKFRVFKVMGWSARNDA